MHQPSWPSSLVPSLREGLSSRRLDLGRGRDCPRRGRLHRLRCLCPRLPGGRTPSNRFRSGTLSPSPRPGAPSPSPLQRQPRRRRRRRNPLSRAARCAPAGGSDGRGDRDVRVARIGRLRCLLEGGCNRARRRRPTAPAAMVRRRRPTAASGCARRPSPGWRARPPGSARGQPSWLSQTGRPPGRDQRGLVDSRRWRRRPRRDDAFLALTSHAPHGTATPGPAATGADRADGVAALGYSAPALGCSCVCRKLYWLHGLRPVVPDRRTPRRRNGRVPTHQLRSRTVYQLHAMPEDLSCR
ncbi:MAG: hypothetical protein OET79_16980, partial [Nitrospirota bacterium]|nr:hypothetical protein [Nitrospirota bacterium]